MGCLVSGVKPIQRPEGLRAALVSERGAVDDCETVAGRDRHPSTRTGFCRGVECDEISGAAGAAQRPRAPGTWGAPQAQERPARSRQNSTWGTVITTFLHPWKRSSPQERKGLWLYGRRRRRRPYIAQPAGRGVVIITPSALDGAAPLAMKTGTVAGRSGSARRGAAGPCCVLGCRPSRASPKAMIALTTALLERGFFLRA